MTDLETTPFDFPSSTGGTIRQVIGGLYQSHLFQAHPWHGVHIGHDAPGLVNCYIEVVPTDTVKYELDKDSGLLKVDRPQTYSNTCPFPYGLIPQTLCGELVAKRCMEATGRTGVIGDGDPIDMCVVSERPIPHGNILLTARVIGGLRMIDHNEADDKLIAVMKQDPAFGNWQDINDCPPSFIERLKHYFLTYKQQPGMTSPCEIAEVYGCDEARRMITLSQEDYKRVYSPQHGALSRAMIAPRSE
jgi:inorganic pyrophosphatase